MPKLSLLQRRRLSPEKLKAARLNARQFNVAELARAAGIHRTAYLKWENPQQGRKTHIDYVALNNVLVLLNVAYEDITDPISQDGAA